MNGKPTYDTPYGHWEVQAASPGTAVYRLRSPAAPAAARDLEAAAAIWRGLPPHRALPQLQSVELDDLRVTWTLAPSVAWIRLDQLGRVATPREAKRVVVALGKLLSVLHRGGLAAFDLSPNLVFVDQTLKRVTLLPTLALAKRMRPLPPRTAAPPFLAPELYRTGGGPTDCSRADVYGLGALARYLLTGTGEVQPAGLLPGEQDPALAPWDAFVDGCCRSNPARRYGDVDQAIDSLRLRDASRKEQWKLLAVAGAGMFVLMLALLLLFRPPPIERGFGDTVLRYQDRSYDDSQWGRDEEFDQAVKRFTDAHPDAANLPATIELRRITGWDDGNFWISAGLSTGGAVLFGKKDGHWTTAPVLIEKVGTQHTLRLLQQDSVLFVGAQLSGRGITRRSTTNEFYEVSAANQRKLGSCNRSNVWNLAVVREAVVVSPDLWFFCGDPLEVLKVESGQFLPLAHDKVAAVHLRATNDEPISGYYACWLRHARTPYEGESFAVFRKANDDGPPKLGHFRDENWYVKEGDLPSQPTSFLDMWLGGSVGDYFVVLVGRGARVHVRKVNERVGRDLTLTFPGKETSLNLIRAWGVSLKKFWAMDDTGTIWESVETPRGLESRVVVRGLQANGVKFRDAWVSPAGKALALTEKNEIYGLE